MAKCNYCDNTTFMTCTKCDNKPICPKHARKAQIGYVCLDHSGNDNLVNVDEIMRTSRAKGIMRKGAWWFAAGLAVTIISSLGSGDSFILWWGPMLYGAFQIVMGLIEFFR